MEVTASTLEELSRFAKDVYDKITPHDDHATLITLTGDLGAGKTAFVKELAKHFGIEAHITSPTFVLSKQYPLQDEKFTTLIHIDAYRLEGDENLKPVAFEEMLYDPSNIILLEWPERVEDELPGWEEKISINNDSGVRTITYEK